MKVWNFATAPEMCQLTGSGGCDSVCAPSFLSVSSSGRFLVIRAQSHSMASVLLHFLILSADLLRSFCSLLNICIIVLTRLGESVVRIPRRTVVSSL